MAIIEIIFKKVAQSVQNLLNDRHKVIKSDGYFKRSIKSRPSNFFFLNKEVNFSNCQLINFFLARSINYATI